MKPFERLTGTAVVVYRSNIDTDVILPARYLNAVSRTGLGRHAFADLRVEPDNVFDAVSSDHSPILIAGGNFGCGSSREHAVWALVDFGIRVVIAPGFADIFASNASKNGLLLVSFPPDIVELLKTERGNLTVDLDKQTVETQQGDEYRFAIEASRKEYLQNGLDEIESTLTTLAPLEAYELKARSERPWVFPIVDPEVRAPFNGRQPTCRS